MGIKCCPSISGSAGLTVEEFMRSLTRTYSQLHHFSEIPSNQPELIDAIVYCSMRCILISAITADTLAR